jgi:hypothetical protein
LSSVRITIVYDTETVCAPSAVTDARYGRISARPSSAASFAAAIDVDRRLGLLGLDDEPAEVLIRMPCDRPQAARTSARTAVRIIRNW